MSRDQRTVQSSAWRRRVQGLACARQVQSKAGEGLGGLCLQFGCTQVQLLGSARVPNSVVAVPTSTDPMGILRSTREFKVPGAGKEHTSEVRGGDRNPDVRSPGSGLGRETARSKFFSDRIVCVTLFLLNRSWGIVTVPGSIPYGSRPGVSGSSPSTLTTSLVIPVPSSSSSNGPNNYSVDNHDLVSWRLRRLVRSKVRSVSFVRVLGDENDSSGMGSQSLSNRRHPQLK